MSNHERDPETAAEASRRTRDDLAEDRTQLANDRTLAAWWRTAMAAIAAAIVFPRLFSDIEPDWLLRAGASGLALLALVVLALGFRRYRATAARIAPDHVARLSRVSLLLGTALLAGVALLSGALAWL
ncbi:DUF202 domain-containing protein [Salinarimonas rosea]|uniref:DUF202 domain-containing protein n=1 Tax=Salinarimonas rosea TaxID=552063 RepID=UPI00041C2601|nr:DUF202 domain-containing protein [Salinarimonas rosea]